MKAKSLKKRKKSRMDKMVEMDMIYNVIKIENENGENYTTFILTDYAKNKLIKKGFKISQEVGADKIEW